MPSAEIITIGTEILLGEIVDTNAPFLARSLRGIGVDLYRKTSVGDNVKRIALVIQEALQRSDIIITTGGLGPTVDDPTRQAVALAVGTDLEYRAELWEQIQERFTRYGRKPTENNKRQAYIPRGSAAIENPVGTAPCFIVTFPIDGKEHIILSLPGVPREMEYLMEHNVLPYLREHYGLHGVIKARVLHTSGIGESMIDDRIGDLEELSNPTVGLAAHSGQVDVRVTAKAGSETEADEMIARVEADLRQRLGDWIYGADEDTLESVAIQALRRRGWKLASVEAGLGGELAGRLSSAADLFGGGQVMASLPNGDSLLTKVKEYQQSQEASAGLGVALQQVDDRYEIFLALSTPEGDRELRRSYGGHPGYATRWALNLSLDLLRKL